jgi:hypothetical protein
MVGTAMKTDSERERMNWVQTPSAENFFMKVMRAPAQSGHTKACQRSKMKGEQYDETLKEQETDVDDAVNVMQRKHVKNVVGVTPFPGFDEARGLGFDHRVSVHNTFRLKQKKKKLKRRRKRNKRQRDK